MLLKLFFLFTFFNAGAQEINFFQVRKVETSKHRAQAFFNTDDQQVSVGQKLEVETPHGSCFVYVTDVYAQHFYVNTEQCSLNDIRIGTPLVAKDESKKPEADSLVTFEDNDSALQTNSYLADWQTSEFYQNYIADKLSTYLTYQMGNTLQGEIRIDQQNTIEELSGAHTIGFGAEYVVAKLPQRLSFSSGFTYELPRSFGKYTLKTTEGQTTASFSQNPTLYLWSLYGNLRYQIMPELLAYIGVNRLLADMKHLPGGAGDVSGDFGFHFGARYYPYDRFYAEASMNFYNLNYKVAGSTFDLDLTELEIKGGYTF